MPTPEYKIHIDAIRQQDHIYLDFLPESNIRVAIETARLMAINNPKNLPVKFQLNGVEFSVRKDTNAEDIVTLYQARLGKK